MIPNIYTYHRETLRTHQSCRLGKNHVSSSWLCTMEREKSADDIVSVDGHQARDLLASGQRYLDVRMKEDFEAKGHVEGAVNIPFYASVTPQGKIKNLQFLEQVSAIFGKDDNFIVGCQSGVRSRIATTTLLNAGFGNVKNMGGGYNSWIKTTNEEL